MGLCPLIKTIFHGQHVVRVKFRAANVSHCGYFCSILLCVVDVTVSFTDNTPVTIAFCQFGNPHSILISVCILPKLDNSSMSSRRI